MAKNYSNSKTSQRTSAQPRLHQRAAEIQAYGSRADVLSTAPPLR
jgi:hypothetical protein